MGEAVGDHEAGGAVDEVVAGDLIEDALGDRDGGGFVFDDHEGAEAFAGEDDGVAAAEGAVEAQGYFVGGQLAGVGEGAGEVGGEVLAHPLLRGQGDGASAQGVEYARDSVGAAGNPGRYRGEVEPRDGVFGVSGALHFLSLVCGLFLWDWEKLRKFTKLFAIRGAITQLPGGIARHIIRNHLWQKR